MMGRLLAAGVLFVLAAMAAGDSWQAANASGRPTGVAAPVPALDPHPVVALTFDDLPTAGGLLPGQTRAEIAASLAAELKAHHLEGVYGFVNAVDLEGNPDAQQALRIWVRAGMNIGNHTWSHPSLTDVTAAAYEHDIARNEPTLAEHAQGRDWRWFRYPYLEEGDTLEKRHAVRAWLRARGYRVAQVTLNFNDDEWADAYNRCAARQDDAAIAWLRRSYLENAKEFIRVGREEQQIAFGREIPNVLLLHETAFTTQMLPALLELLGRQGFRFAPLAKIERDPAYSLDPDAALKDGGSLPNQFLNSRHLKYPPFKPEPFDKLETLCK
ncbi:MAG: polysaccharide deacetylase family protein [Terracidiphilus sp.]